MIQYGFEREFFVIKQNKYVLCPNTIPHDDCGYLAESRSEPHGDPLKAAYLLLAEEERMRRLMPKGLKLKLIDTIELEPELLRQALRVNGKSALPHERGSLYGLDYPANDHLCRAGLHVHFSNIFEIRDENKYLHKIPQILNMPEIIQRLDRAFKKEIETAQRLPGLYEMKAHGFEYRSLPASIDVCRVADVLGG
jgi:hypothetical protein